MNVVDMKEEEEAKKKQIWTKHNMLKTWIREIHLQVE